MPIHFDQFPALLLLYPLLASIVVCAGRQIHIHKCSLSDLVHVLNAFHSFQLSKPLNISWKMIFWELFKNKIVQIPLYSFRKIQTLSAAVHAFFYLFSIHIWNGMKRISMQSSISIACCKILTKVVCLFRNNKKMCLYFYVSIINTWIKS